MHGLSTVKKLALAGLILAAFTSTSAQAYECEICKLSFTGNSWCRGVQEMETGVTQCENHVANIGGSYCTEDGNACSWVNAVGGGGGGTGGWGGGGGCTATGFCPAECFSCGGGGAN